MNVKNLSLSGLAGAVVNFLLGWLVYGILLKDMFKQPEESTNNMILIFVACLVISLFIAYIFLQWAQIKTLKTGAKAGAIIGFFMGLNYNIWVMIMDGRDLQTLAIDVVVTVVTTAITGAVIGLTIGKLEN